GFLVLNYWLHGYQMPKGVRSQWHEAGSGSRRWVDAKQPHSPSLTFPTSGSGSALRRSPSLHQLPVEQKPIPYPQQ
ncbi:Hypothetical predicted protein, partial [Marmota monax]